MKKINEWLNTPITWKTCITSAIIGMGVTLVYLVYGMLRLKKFKY